MKDHELGGRAFRTSLFRAEAGPRKGLGRRREPEGHEERIRAHEEAAERLDPLLNGRAGESASSKTRVGGALITIYRHFKSWFWRRTSDLSKSAQQRRHGPFATREDAFEDAVRTLTHTIGEKS
jgi:hypothetical protein